MTTPQHGPPPDPQPAEVTAPAGLRGNRDFRIVLSGQAGSALGDAVSLTAMPLLVLFLTGSGALMGLVAALQLVPDLLFGLLAGALADRWDRRRMMLWADTGRAVLTAMIPISYWLGLPTMAVILIVAMPVSALRVLSDSAFSAAVPSLVGRENLARANSYMEATLSVPFILGPALAGVLVATIGAPATMAIDAASFALSAASLLLVRRRMRAGRAGGAGPLPHVLADIGEGIRFVWRHRALRMIVLYWSVMAIATAALVPTLGYYITIDRRFGPELFGFVGSAWSVGYLFGSLVAGRLGRERVGLRLLAAGGLLGVMIGAMAVTAAPPAYLVAGFGIGAALAIQLVLARTLRASVTPDELMGRVGSTARTLTVGLQSIGLLAGGAVIEGAGGGPALLAMGGLAVAASLLFGLSRRLRDAANEPEPSPEPEPPG